ncbi:hypothetical protein CDAR_542871 [Caerostris darwini]|uniref:Uncharacterized protein n=1 Tax=Caerostris darwini TaxID=1538125 RepID=A0AAV4N946_9ARAC|nr:hypothetical protein CDAR_542871 [Caerostris darwini]
MLIRVSASKLIESLTTRSLLQISALVGYTLATGGGNYGSGSGSGGGGGNYGSVSGGGGGNYGTGSSIGYSGGGSRASFGGNYGGQNFDYNAADEQGNSHYRTEEGDASGTVRGTCGYTDNQGLYRVVEYVADAGEFRANVRTNEPGTDGKESPADVQLTVEQPPAGIQNSFSGMNWLHHSMLHRHASSGTKIMRNHENKF